MKLFNIIAYWFNIKTGESRTNKNWMYLKVGNSYDEVYKWAQENKKEFYFRFDDVYEPGEVNDSNLKFDFSIQEVSDIFVKDINNNEYRIKSDIVSRIETKKIEILLNKKE